MNIQYMLIISFLFLINFYIIKLIAVDVNKIDDIEIRNISQYSLISDTTNPTIISTFSSNDEEIQLSDPVTTQYIFQTTESINDSLLDNDFNGKLFDDTTFINNTIMNNDKLSSVINSDIPKFLSLSNDDAKKLYYEIQQNTNMKKSNIEKASMLWAQEQGETIYELYKEYLKKYDEEKTAHTNHISSIINTLPEEAKDVHKKIQYILDNTNITKSEEENLISKVLGSVNQTIVDTLMKINDGA
uniref:DUF148 domain-containing protein n=1 Tax=Parastrongyloides trichosuri TaxID=131310 RepID=A0A0N4ZDH9_PARTI